MIIKFLFTQSGSDDPFGDEDNHDEIAALAKKFEEKYVSTCSM